MGLWSVLGPAVMNIGGSFLSQATQQKGTPGQMGYDYIVPKSVGEQSPTGMYLADYWQKQIEGGLGLTDEERALLRRTMQRGQKGAFYGDKLTPGAYQTGVETGAIVGLGGGRAQANLRPLQSKWLDYSQAIDESINAQEMQTRLARQQLGSQTMLGLSQPYQGQIAPYYQPGIEAEESPWAGILGDIAGNMTGKDWTNIASTVGGWFGNSGGGQTFSQLQKQGLASTPPAGQNYRPGVSQASRQGAGYTPMNMSQYYYP